MFLKLLLFTSLLIFCKACTYESDEDLIDFVSVTQAWYAVFITKHTHNLTLLKHDEDFLMVHIGRNIFLGSGYIKERYVDVPEIKYVSMLTRYDNSIVNDRNSFFTRTGVRLPPNGPDYLYKPPEVHLEDQYFIKEFPDFECILGSIPWIKTHVKLQVGEQLQTIIKIAEKITSKPARVLPIERCVEVFKNDNMTLTDGSKICTTIIDKDAAESAKETTLIAKRLPSSIVLQRFNLVGIEIKARDDVSLVTFLPHYWNKTHRYYRPWKILKKFKNDKY